MRQVVLDTETTGLDWKHGHRVIEIGCVEMQNRRRTDNEFHCFLNPQREIDQAATDVHGFSLDDLRDKPLFSNIARDFLDFVGDAELVIHNAPFDMGFIDNELRLAGLDDAVLAGRNSVLDTLVLARQMNPGQRNSLDALCKRYGIDNSRRDLHGALLDAELLAAVYLVMTGGQVALSLGDGSRSAARDAAAKPREIERDGLQFVALALDASDADAHEAQLDLLDEKCATGSVWRRAGSC